MKIKVEPVGGRDYGVFVDGVYWCFAKYGAHGMHGASYTFHYHAQSEPIKERPGRGFLASDVVTWSDKHWLSSQGFYGRPDTARREAIQAGKYKTLPERIAETAARLIKKKLIVSPEELTKRLEERAAVALRRREEFEAVSRKRLDDKARKIVKLFRRGRPEIDKDSSRYLGTLIVEAMEWARSNT